MSLKFVSFFILIALAFGSVAWAQTPAPAETPAASPAKHRGHKKKEPKETATPAAGTESATPASGETPSPSVSPSVKHRRSSKKEAVGTTAETPSTKPAPGETPAASPAAEKHRNRKKAVSETTPVPSAPTVSATPKPSILGSFFSKKPAPAATTPAPANAPATTSTTTAPNAPKSEVSTAPAPGGGNGLVWVNTKTHIYHRQGSRFYGKTKEGKYMSEQEAIKEGDRAAAKGQ